ncbi:MAG: type I restriction enzyme HsdR N-terminal domain-containing protein, partial [Clostridiales bacterium]|nr:type I restriction enzyme HsdR N-terminal domain-containing protein [Clostridiales bacterium]
MKIVAKVTGDTDVNQDFVESVRSLANKAATLQGTLQTEEATKMSLIVPMFTAMGYDVFNPNEFCPEYTADVGIKKGEKVDYAILQNGKPTILVECKSCSENLEKYGSQLFRYFSTTSAKFGILTNGVQYRFYTDLNNANVMDMVPFLVVDLLDLKDSSVAEMKKFC